MCGICGFNWKDEALVKRMVATIKHRGPDARGSFSDEHVTFGHARLAIIDLSARGRQPMGLDANNRATSEENKLADANIIIVFNGEIYNFQELRSEIGGAFQSGSDTEVILRAYKKWGPNCVTKFNGMWAFCIYDKKKGVLFCSRDRLGVKPFHYFYDGESFIFSSEIKGVLSVKALNKSNNLNNDALKLYFSLGYIPAPLTVYNEIFKLEAGHNITFNLQTHTLTKVKYYELPEYAPLRNKKLLVEKGRQILYDATRLRMIADVPVGAFLSGGLDSSSVVGAMSKYTALKNLHTFSIGFEKKYDHGQYDETRYMKLVKRYFKTRHHHYTFKEKDFQQLIKKYAFMFDEPFWDYSGFPTYKVSEMARKHVTVVLSGDGGDEVFGGYTSHRMGAGLELIRKTPKFFRDIGSRIPVKKNLDSTTSLYLLKEALDVSLKNKECFYAESLPEDSYKPEIYKNWTTEKLAYALKKGGNDLSEGLRIYDLLFNTLQDNFLVKVDRASMQAPVEVRSPFLDYRFIEFAQTIPKDWKASPTKTKILMRTIIKDLVPKEIVNRGKQGFEPPLDKWILDKKYENYLKSHLDILNSIDPELYRFYKDTVMKSKNKFHNIYRIKLFLFLKWQERWL